MFILFHLGRINQFVAKPVDSSSSSVTLRNSWRRSTSNEEKILMDDIDGPDECRKKTFKTVKAICKDSPILRQLTSFHLKMIFLNAIEQYPSMTWHAGDFYERVFDFLGFIEQFLEAKTLPHYLIKGMNIFRTFKDIDSMLRRIRRLRTNKATFFRVIGVSE